MTRSVHGGPHDGEERDCNSDSTLSEVVQHEKDDNEEEVKSCNVNTSTECVNDPQSSMMANVSRETDGVTADYEAHIELQLRFMSHGWLHH